ncbi:hypothetical protein BDZ88DRAFT_439280 [Geranomyces variabilis]|nr:hypothetical protein BDZ88DRAFT_439280 [Geranomyces variabilis]KAJ3140552.1 hypothetical protein HDU90_007852 [Geranomyces variabilis]
MKGTAASPLFAAHLCQARMPTVEDVRAAMAEFMPYVDQPKGVQIVPSPLALHFTTLEGLKCDVAVDDGGFLLQNLNGKSVKFESLQALLSTVSVGYRSRFSDDLSARLQQVLADETSEA